MPPAFSSHDEWRPKMYTTFEESNHYSYRTKKKRHPKYEPFSGDDFLDEYLQRQSKKDIFIEQQSDYQSWKSYAASERRWLDHSTADENHSARYTRKPSMASTQTTPPTAHQTRWQDQYTTSSTRTSRSSTSYNAECPKITRKKMRKISVAKWQELEKKSWHEQKQFLDKYLKEGKFKAVRVSSKLKNVREGDHLFYQGAGGLYDHHLLCTDVRGGRIYTIEYTGPDLGVAAASRSAATSDVLAFAAIKEGSLTYQELEKKNAKIRKWPEELQRFKVEEVIERAKSRKKESEYHAFSNNCESFVNWCKCGLNISLQVKEWYQPAWDGVKAVGSSAIEGLKKYGISTGVPVALKAIGNVSDELIGAISSPLSPVGFAVGGAIETGFAAWSIFKDHGRMKKGLLSKRQFKINSVGTVSKAAGHVAGGITGSLIGSVLGPLGSIAGGAIGYGVGHIAGSAVGWCYEHAPKIWKGLKTVSGRKVCEGVKTVGRKVCEGVKTVGRKVCEGVKTVGRKVWEGVKTVGRKVCEGVKTVGRKVCEGVKTVGRKIGSFFKSLFSW